MQTGHSVTQYYRCPPKYFDFAIDPNPSSRSYFTFGPNATCYGNITQATPVDAPSQALHDALPEARAENGKIHLPFNPDEIIENIRGELYTTREETNSLLLLSQIYYCLRPLLPLAVRSRIQRLHFRHRNQRPFPDWPIDCSVDNIFETLLLLAIRANAGAPIPFIWFWPEGKTSCVIMTHDVESTKGRDFCAALMDIDASHGFKSSFQIIPEDRYSVSDAFLQSIRRRGFEVAVHDLNHDGRLYRNRAQFLHRADKINGYLNHFQTEGFRSGALYRQQPWYDSLKCAYDMSVPNTARFDPQGGGCCTVMPYFVGGILEIPVSTIQDYTLFHILNDYTLNIWRHQTRTIMEKHGLMSFIVHPDYILNPRALHSYESLLRFLDNLRQTREVWTATPGEVNQWWRQRASMSLTHVNGEWKISGEGSTRAQLAFASEVNGRLTYTLQEPSSRKPLQESTSHCTPHRSAASAK